MKCINCNKEMGNWFKRKFNQLCINACDECSHKKIKELYYEYCDKSKTWKEKSPTNLEK